MDAVRTARDWPLPLIGLLDEPAHLLTAWLALAALAAIGPVPRRGFAIAVLAGAVLLDLDHIPLFLGMDVAATPGGRPVTHSLLTVAVLLAAAWVFRRGRLPLAGLAAGVVTQLLRDLSTGPGVPLLWPLAPDDVRLPYLPYLLVVTAVAAVATVQRQRSLRGT